MTRDGLWTFGGIAGQESLEMCRIPFELISFPAVELVNTLMFQLNLQTLSGIAFT